MAAGDGLELFDAHCHLQVPSALRTPCPVAHCSERLLDQQATANVPAGPPTGALPAPRDGRGARRGRAALCGERLLGGRLGRGQQALPGVFLPCSLRSSVSHAHARAAQVGQLAADNADVVPNFGLHPWCAVLARSPAALCFAGALAMHEASSAWRGAGGWRAARRAWLARLQRRLAAAPHAGVGEVTRPGPPLWPGRRGALWPWLALSGPPATGARPPRSLALQGTASAQHALARARSGRALTPCARAVRPGLWAARGSGGA